MAETGRAALDFALQISLQNEQMLDEAHSMYDEIKKIFSTPIVIGIEARANVGKARQDINALDKGLTAVESSAENVQKELSEVDKRAANAARKIESHFKGASKRIQDAVGTGGDKAVDAEINRLKSKAKAASEVQKMLDVGGLLGKVRSSSSGSSGGEEALKEQLQEIRRISALYKKLDREIEELEQELEDPDNANFADSLEKKIQEKLPRFEEAKGAHEGTEQKLESLYKKHGKETVQAILKGFEGGVAEAAREEPKQNKAKTAIQEAIENLQDTHLQKIQGKIAAAKEKGDKTAEGHYKEVASQIESKIKVLQAALGDAEKDANQAAKRLEVLARGVISPAEVETTARSLAQSLSGGADLSAAARRGSTPDGVGGAFNAPLNIEQMREVASQFELPFRADPEALRASLERAIQSKKFNLLFHGPTIRGQIKSAMEAEYPLKVNTSALKSQVQAALREAGVIEIRTSSKSLAESQFPKEISQVEKAWGAALDRMLVKAHNTTKLMTEGMKALDKKEMKISFGVNEKHLKDRISAAIRDTKSFKEKGGARLPVDRQYLAEEVLKALRHVNKVSAKSKLKIGVDAGELRKALTEVVRNESALAEDGAKLGINRQFFISSVLESVKAINQMKLEVQLASNFDPLVDQINKAAKQVYANTRHSDEQARKVEELMGKPEVKEAVRRERKAQREKERISEERQRDLRRARRPNALKFTSDAPPIPTKGGQKAMLQYLRGEQVQPDVVGRLKESFPALAQQFADRIARAQQQWDTRETGKIRREVEAIDRKQKSVAEQQAERRRQGFLKDTERQAKVDPANRFMRSMFPDLEKSVRQVISTFRKLRTESATYKDVYNGKQAFNKINGEINRMVQDTKKYSVEQIQAMQRWQRGFNSGFGTPVNNQKLAFSPKDAESAYRQELGEFQKAMSSYHGLELDKYANRDRWKEQEQAYRKYVATVQKYESAHLELAQKSTTEEQRAGQEKVKKARESLELARNELRFRMLAERKDGVQMDSIISRPYGGAGYGVAGKQVRNIRDAFGSISRMLEQEFGPIVAKLNADRDKMRADLRSQGRFGQAASIGDEKMDGFLGKMFSGNKEAVNQYLKIQGLSNRTLRNEEQRAAAIRRLIDPLRTNYEIYRKTTRELDKQANQMQRLQRYERMVSVRNQARSNATQPLQNTMRAMSYRMGGYGAGMMIAWQMREAMRTYMEFDDEIKGIQGVLRSKSEYDAENLAVGIAETAGRFGADLVETAKAARILAQTGLDANETLTELNFTMMAMRGMDMTIEQMQELQIAVRAVAGEAAGLTTTLAVLEKISAVESTRAVTAQDLSEAIKIVGPMLNQYSNDMAGMGDAISQSIGMATVMVEQLRISGSRAGNAMKFIFARILRPNVLNSLQDDFGLRLADSSGRELLALPDLLGEIASKYKELQDQGDGARAKQLAVTLAGGRQVNTLIALLEQYDESVAISREATHSFGSAQERVEIRMDSMKTKVGELRTSFNLFTKSLMDNTGASILAKKGMEGMAAVMGGVSGQGGGMGALSLIALGTSATVGGARRGIGYLGATSDAAHMGMTVKQLREMRRLSEMRKLGMDPKDVARAGGTFTRALSGVTRMLTPTGTIITGTLLLATILGTVAKKAAEGGDALDKYRVNLKSLEELEIWDSPQMADFQSIAGERGFGTAQRAYTRVRDALVTPVEGGKIQEVFARYSTEETPIESFEDLHNFMVNNRDEWEGLRTIIADALIEDLGEAGEQLRSIEDDQTRVAQATRLIGLSAWTANFDIARSIEALRQTTQTMIDDTLRGLDRLDARKRTGFWAETWGAIGDVFSGTDLLNKQIGSIRTALADANMEEFRGLTEEQLNERIANITPEQRARMRGTAVGDHIMGKSLDSLPEAVSGVLGTHGFSDVLKETLQEAFTAGDGDLSIADALWRAAQTIDRESGDDVRRVTLPSGEKVSVRESLEQGFRNQYLAAANMNGVLQDLGVNPVEVEQQQESTDSFKAWLQELMASGQEAAVEEAVRKGASREAAETKFSSLLVDYSGAADRMKLIIDGTGKALGNFHDKLLEAMLSFRQQMMGAVAEQDLADLFGFGFNRADSEMQAARSAYVSVRQLVPGMEDEALKLNAELQRLNDMSLTQAMQGAEALEAGDTEDPGAQAAQQIREKQQEVWDRLDNIRNAFRLISEEGVKLQDMINVNTPEGQSLLAFLNGEGNFDPANVLASFKSLLLGVIEDTRRITLLQQEQGHLLEIQKISAEKYHEIRKATLENETSLTRRVMAREAMEKEMLDYQIAMVRARVGEDEAKIRREVEMLRVQAGINTLAERELEVIRAKNELTDQTRSNMQSMFAGLRTIADTNLWGQIFDGEAKFGGMLQQMIAPIGDTLRDRITENLMSELNELMLGLEGMQGLASSPEVRMKQKIEEAANLGGLSFANSIQTASAVGAGEFYRQIVAASQVASGLQSGQHNLSSAGVVTDASGVILSSPSIRGIGSRRSGGSAKMGTQQRISWDKASGQLAMMLAPMVGTALGSAAGGSGRGASTGASLGSGIGAVAGSVIPGIGTVAGSIAGSLLGGLVGGMFGDDDSGNPTIKSLSAIEMAQKETISAIEQQTDALLNPANSLLNAPTTFSIPAYRSAFMAGGGGSQTVNTKNEVTLNLSVPGGDPQEVKRVAVEAVEEALYGSRRAGSSKSSNF